MESECRGNGTAVALNDDAKMYGLGEEKLVTPEPEEEMLDYHLYYPTMLPLRPPGTPAEAEDDSVAAALPTDLLSLEVSRFWCSLVEAVFIIRGGGNGCKCPPPPISAL